MSKEAMQLALEALEDANDVARMEFSDENYYSEAINALRQALSEQPSHQEVDWEKLYRLEVKKKEALAAKYERDTGKKLTRIVPMAEPAQRQALETEQEPVISTDHGPWIPSTLPGEEGETYCKRCLLRDKFFGSRQCDPHFVYKDPPQRKPQALAQPEQEPVAWMHNFIEGNVITHIPADIGRHPERWTPLYTAPPKAAKWIGLTAYEIQEIHSGNQHWGNFACAIEAKLKEKNT